VCTVICTLLWLGGVVGPNSPALAYDAPPTISATTEPAAAAGPTTAELQGIVNTNGTAVRWQFQFGPSPAYDNATPMQSIPAGAGEVAVSAPLTGLIPLTVYHFRVVAMSMPTNGDPAVTIAGEDLSFTTTAAGWVRLPFLSLKVTLGHVTLPLRCDSQMPCSGQYLITTVASIDGYRDVNLACGIGSFSLNPGQARRLHPKVSHSCLRLIKHRSRHRIKVRVMATPTTSQFAFVKSVPLEL